MESDSVWIGKSALRPISFLAPTPFPKLVPAKPRAKTGDGLIVMVSFPLQLPVLSGSLWSDRDQRTSHGELR